MAVDTDNDAISRMRVLACLFCGTWCLDPREPVSRAKAHEIDRALRSYPDLSDDEFVEANPPRGWHEN